MLDSAEREALLHALGAEESRLTETERTGLDRDGYVILRDILSPEQLADVRAALERLIAQARLDPTWHAGGTLHLNDLVNDPAFDAVWKSDRLLSAIVHVIGYDLRIGSVSYRAPKPGYGAQTLHADYMQGYRGDYQVATAILALEDFTETNGPTRIVPGSHLPGDFVAIQNFAGGNALVFYTKPGIYVLVRPGDPLAEHAVKPRSVICRAPRLWLIAPRHKPFTSDAFGRTRRIAATWGEANLYLYTGPLCSPK